MIKKIPLKSNKQLYLEGFNLTKLPIKFEVGKNNRQLSEFIFNLFGSDFYLVISGSVSHADVRDMLEYNEEMRIAFEGEANNPFPKLSTPSYKILCNCKYEKLDCFNYNIVKVEDIDSLNFFFSTGGDDTDICIFSDDYSLDFLSNIWFEILEYKWSNPNDVDFKFYEYLYSKYSSYIGTKDFALIDTYGEDEDPNNYLLISSRKLPLIEEVNKTLMKDQWQKTLSDLINK